LQVVQAESQLVETRLTDQGAALTALLAHLSSEPHKHEFKGITEIAQLFSQKQTQISLFDTLEEIAELTLKLERREALMKLAQTVHSFNTHWQYQSSGLPEQLQAISEQITELNNKVPNYKFRGMNELAKTLYERHTAQVLAEGPGAEQLQQLAEELRRHMGLRTTAQPSMNPPMVNFAPSQKLTNTSRATQNKQEEFKSRANSVRELPLAEVTECLGLEQDRRDKHKWKGVGQTISINGQKFYDHLAQKGGYGAIDLVMHVQERNFNEAVDWLSNDISKLPRLQARSPQPQISQERQPFQPPVPDEDKWQQVREYLIEQRGLPAPLVDELHSSGKIYAAGLEPEALEKLRSKGYSEPEKITNAVFLRHNLAQETTGASLRGVSEGSSFKGLATGSNRDNGWFSFTKGEGHLERIVLVEWAIDAMSAAALAKQPGRTMFISTDGAGSVPVDWLQQHQAQGIQIIAAHDTDRTGGEMAWRLAVEVPAISRATPTRGKDWNEYLLSEHQPNHPETSSDPSEWSRVAQAIGKPVSYIERIKAVTGAKNPLPEQAKTAMQQDFHAYRQTSRDLWQWHKTAAFLGESEVYLKRITEVAISFHHPKQTTPLSQTSLDSMQLDQQKFAYRLRYQELLKRVRQYPKFENSPAKEVDIGIALLVIKESTDPNEARRVLAQSDQLKE
jgi:hypothetical protein